MDDAIDFIRDFKPSFFGLDNWGLWICFGVIILVFVVANWLTSFLQPKVAKIIKSILAVLFYTVFFSVMLLAILNSILTARYDRLTIMIFILILPYLKRWVGNFYKKYDAFVDRLANK